MNDAYHSSMSTPGKAVPFLLAQSSTPTRQPRNKLAGFAKVLAGGRVVGLNKEKPFADRMLADGVTCHIQEAGLDDPKVEQIILESVATNLEAGVKLLDKQEVALARMGGRLSEMALSLNRARADLSQSMDAQAKFEEARHHLQLIARETFDHTALFSMGESKPITIAVPAGKVWEGLSIDRCNLKTPGFDALNAGKVSPSAKGLLLDPETFTLVFKEWRHLCAGNRLQWHLVYSRWQSIVSTLKYFLGGRRWTPPLLPDETKQGGLRRPHLDN